MAVFLYALRRDLLWNVLQVHLGSPELARFYTPFGVTFFGTHHYAHREGGGRCEFLYALRRDLLWNPTLFGEPVTSADATGCALPEDVDRLSLRLDDTGDPRADLGYPLGRTICTVSPCPGRFYTPCGVTLFWTFLAPNRVARE
jgi:hypothetical protein